VCEGASAVAVLRRDKCAPCSLKFCSAGKGKEPSQANVGQASSLPVVRASCPQFRRGALAAGSRQNRQAGCLPYAEEVEMREFHAFAPLPGRMLLKPKS